MTKKDIEDLVFIKQAFENFVFFDVESGSVADFLKSIEQQRLALQKLQIMIERNK